MSAVLGRLLADLTSACKKHYGSRLRAVAVFGSVVARHAAPPPHDSDIDLLPVIDDLPDGRVARADDFTPVERAVTTAMLDQKERRPPKRSPLPAGRHHSQTADEAILPP
jgi:predicted nucleotidyltransferase